MRRSIGRDRDIAAIPSRVAAWARFVELTPRPRSPLLPTAVRKTSDRELVEHKIAFALRRSATSGLLRALALCMTET